VDEGGRARVYGERGWRKERMVEGGVGILSRGVPNSLHLSHALPPSLPPSTALSLAASPRTVCEGAAAGHADVVPADVQPGQAPVARHQRPQRRAACAAASGGGQSGGERREEEGGSEVGIGRAGVGGAAICTAGRRCCGWVRQSGWTASFKEPSDRETDRQG
jgi:hypothetical protein